jgi:hypothetical protein
MDTNRLIRAVISAGCVVAASLCLAASYISAAIMTSTLPYAYLAAHTEEGFCERLKLTWPLLVIAAALYITTGIIAISAIRQKAARSIAN